MTYRIIGKRVLDLVLSVTVLVALSPVLIAAALAIKLTSRGPVFFRQERVGQGARAFSVLKLRTMTDAAHDTRIQTLPGDPNVTAVGHVLRRLKVDELPQLINVVAGEMSLVGPRPCLRATFDEMPEWARARFSVKPGMTGLAQVNGNVALPWEQRWRFDVAYASGCSLRLDLYIIAKTILVVFMGESRFQNAS